MRNKADQLTAYAVGGTNDDREQRALLVSRSVGIDAFVLTIDGPGYAPGTECRGLAIERHEGSTVRVCEPGNGHAVIVGHCHPDETMSILEVASGLTVANPAFTTTGVAKIVLADACGGTAQVIPLSAAPRWTWGEATEIINLFENSGELFKLRLQLLGDLFMSRSASTIEDGQSSFERFVGLKVRVKDQRNFERAVAARLATVDPSFEPLSTAVAAISHTDPEYVATAIGCYQHSGGQADTKAIGEAVLAELTAIPGFVLTVPDCGGFAVMSMLAKAAGCEPPDAKMHHVLVRHALKEIPSAATTDLIKKYAAATKNTNYSVYASPGMSPSLEGLIAIAVLKSVLHAKE